MAVVVLSTISVCGADMCSYVQDGLVALYDGLYNNITESGSTNHAVGVQTWHNLVTGRKTELSAGSVDVESVAYSFSGTGSYFSETIPGLSNAVVTTGLTIEYVSEYTSLSSLGVGVRVGSLGPYYQNSALTYSVKTGQLSTWMSPAATGTRHSSSFVYGPSYVLDDTTSYLDGKRYLGDHRIGWNSTYAPSDLVKVGNYSASHGAVGKIYTVRIYNRCLSDEEIAINAAVDRVRYGTREPVEMRDAVWTGAGTDDELTTPDNLTGEHLDFSAGSVRPTIAPSDAVTRTVTVGGAYSLHGLAFTGTAVRFGTKRNSADAAVSLGESGIDVTDASNVEKRRHAVDVPLVIAYDQTWDFATNATVELLKPLCLDFLAPNAQVVKTGPGTLWLRGGPSTFCGTYNVATGRVYATGVEPFGPGATVIVQSKASKNQARLVVSNAVISSLLDLKSGDPNGRTALEVVGGTTNVLNGPIKHAGVDSTVLGVKSYTVFGGGYGSGYSCLNVSGTLVVSNKPFATSTWEGSCAGLTVFCCPSNATGSLHQWNNGTLNPFGQSWYNGAAFNFQMEADRALWMTSRACLNSKSTWDLNGHDIQIGTLWAQKGCRIRSFGGPATMRVRQQEGSYDLARLDNGHEFMGELSLYKYGTSTLKLSGVHTATGCVTVAEGELCFTNNASWAMATNVQVVGSATLRAYNTAVLGRKTELTIGAAEGETAVYAFGADGVEVPGVQTVGRLVLNGVEQQQGAYYVAVGNPGRFEKAIETSRIQGHGAIYVRPYGACLIVR